MKIYYDDQVDALYLKLGDVAPDGVVELSDGVGLDTTSEGRLVGIEILNASRKIDLTTILSYQLALDDPVRFLHPGKSDPADQGTAPA